MLCPEEIVDPHSIVAIPAVLGAGLAVGAALALGTTLVASVRLRRSDPVVLKTVVPARIAAHTPTALLLRSE